MQLARPAIAIDPRRFGRGRQLDFGPAPAAPTVSLGDDVKLFLTTLAAGFIFVSVVFA